jgi:uncharacterized protein YkwD
LPIAIERSADMANRGYFSHTTPEGTDVHAIFDRLGLKFDWCGEILARNNYPDAETVGVAVESFMESQGHRTNILYAPYVRTAIAEARSENGLRYYAVIFATDK